VVLTLLTFTCFDSKEKNAVISDLTLTLTFTVSVGQELTHANIPLDTVHNRNKTAQIHGQLGLQTFIITLYMIISNHLYSDDDVLS
jgi:hypothetical protein